MGGTTTRFFYGQGGELLSERVVGTGLTAAEYVWLDGKPLAYITNGQVYQVHTDHLGTPQVLTDASGTAAWEAEYRPFGEAVTTGNLSFPLRFPGQYHDAETGLHYNWHRYYDPATGRYLTSDPIGLEGGLNPYLYAEGNPLYFTDPEGLMAPQLIGGGAGLVVGFSANYFSGASFNDALAAGLQSGVAGFISGGGSMLMGFTTAATVSLYSSHFSCNSVGVEEVGNSLVMGGIAAVGGGFGNAIGHLLRPVKMVKKDTGSFQKHLRRFFNIPSKRVDVNKGTRLEISTFLGVSTENVIAGQYSDFEDQGE